MGLGVARNVSGKPIEYVANPAHASDTFYAVQAAQMAFPEVSKWFVVMGNPQGGGAAQRQALEPVDGYLGALSISPVTQVLDLSENGNPFIPILGLFVIPGISGVFSAFDPLDILNPVSAERFAAR